MANGGKLAKPAKGVEAYLEECKKKLEAAMSEQDSALPATSASLSVRPPLDGSSVRG